jgi:pSer/pThr/pTyr-binding forkhead associated (FHA) protein
MPNAKYCSHCGRSVEPVPGLVLRMSSNNIPYHINPEKQIYTVGRAVPQQNNYVDIDLGPFGQRKISRQHARITLQEGDWHVEDMNSKGGTRVYNTRLQPFTPTRLQDGMVVYFADVKFTVEMN